MYAHLDTVPDVDGVGQEVGVVAVVIIVAVVAQQGAEARTFGLKRIHAERQAAPDIGTVGGRVDELFLLLVESYVGDAVVGEQRVEAYVVGNLALLGILLCDVFIGDAATEVAARAQHRLSHRGAQGRVHFAHQHGRFAERLHHPLGKFRLLAAEAVVDP